MAFTTIDFVVLIAYLIFSAGLGFYFARFQRNARDYFLGNRDIPWAAVSLSVVATETSTLTFIGVPALSYGGDMTFLQITVGYLLARILISIILLPRYYHNDLFTAYDFIAHRFGNKTRRVASGIFMVTRLLADGVRLFATAIPLSIITGLSYPVSIAIICAVTILYTYLGGLRAVVWLDVIQIVIYVLGAGLAMYLIVDRLPGGWAQVMALGHDAGKFRMLDFSLDMRTTYTVFSGFIGGTFFTMASHGTDQLMVQRLLACRSLRDSQKALIGSGVLVMLQFFFFLTIGVLLYAFYTTFPERLTAFSLSRNDEIFPLFIAHELPAGLSGLVIAAIFAAAMSTLSSSLNSLASSTIIDWVKPVLQTVWSETRELLISRLTTIAWAVLLIIVATLAGNWRNVLEAGLSIASFTYGGLLGAFLLGLSAATFRPSHVITGMVAGLLTVLVLSMNGIAWPWFVVAGSLVTVAVGYALRAVSVSAK